MKDLRIVFMGTPAFAVTALKKLLENKKNIVGVITSPDKPAGRGRKIRQSAVKEFALSEGLTVLQPTNLKDESFLKQLKSLNANLQIVVAFRMLPKAIWQMPKYGTFNLHASLLPQYRGAAPINWVIINQEEKTGVTTFFIDEKIDTGAIILQEEIKISKNETAGTLHDKLMVLGSNLILKTVDLIKENKALVQPQPQQLDLKPAPKLTSENTKINWDLPVKQIDAFIRGLSPYPVAWTTLVNKDQEVVTKIYSVTYTCEDHKYNNGQVITTKKELKIAAQDGFIVCKELKLAGKRKMDVLSLLNGYHFCKRAKMV